MLTQKYFTFRNFLTGSEELARITSLDPLQDNSSIEPREETSGPEIVPVPSKSPALMLHPETLQMARQMVCGWDSSKMASKKKQGI